MFASCGPMPKEEPRYPEVGKALTEAREGRGMTRDDLVVAYRAEAHEGLSQSVISRWERGTSFPKQSRWAALEVAYGLKPGFFGRYADGRPIDVDERPSADVGPIIDSTGQAIDFGSLSRDQVRLVRLIVEHLTPRK
jgi:transcriptional regulator with XRE-family HTH domain